MYDPRVVANAILAAADAEGTRISHVKLQKLLYLAHGFSLIEHGRPLVNGGFEAWPHGPVSIGMVVPDELILECFEGLDALGEKNDLGRQAAAKVQPLNLSMAGAVRLRRTAVRNRSNHCPASVGFTVRLRRNTRAFQAIWPRADLGSADARCGNRCLRNCPSFRCTASKRSSRCQNGPRIGHSRVWVTTHKRVTD